MAATRWVEGTFLRGGTSKGMFFREQDLPGSGPERDALFWRVMGSPDPFARQLDGMGGGISSLSKVMVVDRSTRPGVDLDYTFGQVAVDRPVVDWSANCGNLSSAVVPFALQCGLLERPDGIHTVELYNTNTDSHVTVRLEVLDGLARTDGDVTMPGVAGTGAPVELVYPEPGGSRTAALWPTGNARDDLVLDGRTVTASLVDATLPVVVVDASDLGLDGTELPDVLDAQADTLARIDDLRRQAAVLMGLADEPSAAPLAVPKVALVSRAAAAPTLTGEQVAADACDVVVRAISMERIHKAVPATAAMCLAAAATRPGSLVAEVLGHALPEGGELAMATPSGVVRARARVADGELTETSILRTARVLMVGRVAC